MTDAVKWLVEYEPGYLDYQGDFDRLIELRDAALPELEAMLNPWRPISEAPKDDGAEAIVAGDFGIAAAVLDDGSWIAGMVHVFPTHWMPLPTPPQGTNHESLGD